MSRDGRYFHGHATGPVELERSWRARPESELPLVVPICSHRRQAAMAPGPAGLEPATRPLWAAAQTIRSLIFFSFWPRSIAFGVVQTGRFWCETGAVAPVGGRVSGALQPNTPVNSAFFDSNERLGQHRPPHRDAMRACCRSRSRSRTSGSVGRGIW